MASMEVLIVSGYVFEVSICKKFQDQAQGDTHCCFPDIMKSVLFVS